MARQKRLTLDGDHFYVDLVFYNRLLRCFVLIDLKLGKLTQQDLGQMQMYGHFFDRHQREEWEAPTVGIVLCSEKNEAMLRITLPEDDEQIHAASYQLDLPTEDQLREHLVAERERLEHARQVAASEPGEEETFLRGPLRASDLRAPRPSRQCRSLSGLLGAKRTIPAQHVAPRTALMP